MSKKEEKIGEESKYVETVMKQPEVMLKTIFHS